MFFKPRKVVVGSDHAGFEYKKIALQLLQELGIPSMEVGATSTEPYDYPDAALELGLAIRSGEASHGILVCGSGIGIAVAADKVPGIRAAVCSETYTARKSRDHNDANVLVLAERVIGIELALEIMRVWLQTPFSAEERHVRRLKKLAAIEQRFCGENAQPYEPPRTP